MWCCFNIADSSGGLITLTGYLSGKSKGVRNNKEKAITSTPSKCFMCQVWQRNQGLFHPVLISRHIEYMTWEFKPFHSTTGCFHFLAAVGTQSKGRGPPCHRSQDSLSVSHHQRTPCLTLFSRGVLSLLTCRQWNQCDRGIHPYGKFQVGAADGNPTSAFSPLLHVANARNFGHIASVCLLFQLHLCTQWEGSSHTPRSLFNSPIPPKSWEKSQSRWELAQQSFGLNRPEWNCSFLAGSEWHCDVIVSEAKEPEQAR